MIDTKAIRKIIEPNLGTSSGVSISIVLELLDSHDELERKLKIAEDALLKIIKSNHENQMINLANAYIDSVQALKQIRGE